jgi:hypothetical protein
MKPRGGHSHPPGTAAPEMWEPYKLWMGDLWECRGCGHELIVGSGYQPISEDYWPDFLQQIESWGAKITINDC